MTDVRPGDVLLVRIRGRSWLIRMSAWAIGLGARMERKPDEWQHVIVAHHHDEAGVFWGLQGQPGVVGSVDLAPYLTDPDTISNVGQPKTDAQRKAICDALTPLDAVARYDWAAIGVDAAMATGAVAWAAPIWKMVGRWGKGSPAHVVCSSMADWAYRTAGLGSPDAGRFTTPGDWAVYIQRKGWAS